MTVTKPLPHDPERESSVRFVVGIDLGTTNCAVSYVDLNTREEDAARGSLVHDFPIPQCVAPDVLDALPTLPSFFARLANVAPLPWDDDPPRDFSTKSRGAGAVRDDLRGAVGAIARDYGAAAPESFISSAKSWLCSSSVDRRAQFLPLRSSRGDGATAQSDAKTPLWSPVDASSFYLSHLRAAWNSRFPEFPLENQDVVVTIPASFDETARQLTLEAAKRAKLPRVALVEEPQAAFYAWLERHEQDWTTLVSPGDRILVCDVGGGTTDFALICALERDDSSRDDAPQGGVRFYRVAVGDHLVLGGDNLDLALCRYLEQKLQERRPGALSPRERAILLRESRRAKEAFLGGGTDEKTRRILLPSASSKLVGGGTVIEVNREEVEKLLVDGFFPKVSLDAVPRRRRGGLREIALSYADDPAITKHLASFLCAHRDAGEALVRAGIVGRSGAKEASAPTSKVDPARPDAILFNGGAFESPKLRERVVDSVVDWFGDGSWRPAVLENSALFLAVARGAAYYGLALRGYAQRIGASLARSYYVQVALEGETAAKTQEKRRLGVCLLPAQAEPGDEITLPREFELEVDKPVAFPISVSSSRTTDAPGDLITLDPGETRELPPIRTALKTRSQAKKAAGRIRARLVARPTEIGTIELFLQEVLPPDAPARTRASRWTLQFDARGATQSDWEAGVVEGEETGVVDESLVEGALTAVSRVFGDEETLAREGLTRLKPGELFKAITDAVGVSRNEIPVTTLRRLAERTLELSEGRRQSAAHEARWLNWLGFALRPGFGASTDDWRVEQAWKSVGGQLAFGTPESRTQYWILWRRVASGLTPGRQRTLAEPLMTNVRALRRQLVEGKGRGADLDLTSQEGAEIWRLLGALELAPLEIRTELGDAILDVVSKKKTQPVREALVWSLGRLGARRLFHAPLDRVVAPEIAARWSQRLLDDLDARDVAPTPTELFALAQLTRPAEDASLDVDARAREKVAAFLLRCDAEETTLAALERHGRLVDEATRQAFGETLPLGLRWN